MAKAAPISSISEPARAILVVLSLLHRSLNETKHILATTGIKQRSYPMRGFGSVASAARLCRVYDEVHQFFRVRTTMKQQVSLTHQREVFCQRLEALSAMVLVA